MVEVSADALLTVINDILDFSKIEAGKLELDAVAFDLRDAVGDTVRAARAARAHRRGWSWPATSPPTCPSALVGDPGRLRQVIVNLVGNAIKFTERGRGGGRESRSHEPGARTATSCLHVRRHATPASASRADKQRGDLRAVRAGRRLDHAQVRRHRPGAGDLGAAGRADGRPDRGGERAGPRQHVPLHRAASHRPARRRPTAGAGRAPSRWPACRVLVVDDNATNRRILEEMLRQLGHAADRGRRRARGARGAATGAAAPATPFALVLLDAMMPEMDGFDVAEQIRRDPALGAGDLDRDARRRPPARGRRRCRELGIAAVSDQAGQAVRPARRDA